MVGVVDEVKVAAADDMIDGFVWAIIGKRRRRWRVFRRAAIAYKLSPSPPQYLRPG